MLSFSLFQTSSYAVYSAPLHENYQTSNCLLKSSSYPSGCMGSTCFWAEKNHSIEILDKIGSGWFDGLHFKQCMLTIHGKLIKGSSLEKILSNIDMLIVGTGNLVHANHINQTHYCLQVSLCALFLILKDGKDSTISSLEWLQLSKNQNEMCNI